MTQCLTDSDLNRYHAGELDEAEEARVREHLAECEQCAQRNAELVARHEEILGRVKGMKLSETEDLRRLRRQRARALIRPQERKVMIIGLDGADWQVMDPLLKAGRLPALAGALGGEDALDLVGAGVETRNTAH
ncbi:MAG: zf-HC2 domain-containing protein [Chloroflexi bacterium]|nr:zf-HC2 domain-containing protein [Chloroflexota bacterium]